MSSITIGPGRKFCRGVYSEKCHGKPRVGWHEDNPMGRC